MALTLNTNVSALVAQKNLSQTEGKLSQTLNRLSSGLRVSSAKDDAAGFTIAEGMRARINGLRQGERNANDGVSLIQTAESGMNKVLSLMQRMRELSLQAKNGTNGATDLSNLNSEFQTLSAEITRTAATTDFNGIGLLAGGTIDIQVGSGGTANDKLVITLAATDAATLGIDALDLTTDPIAALTALDTAISTVTTSMAGLGSNQSNLEEAISGNVDRYTQLEAAKSRIVDTDYAQESSNLAKYQVMEQAGAAMLSQANSASQLVLNLLR